MGGLIVIDFIDMSTLKNKTLVEDMVLESIDIDRAKIYYCHFFFRRKRALPRMPLSMFRP